MKTLLLIGGGVLFFFLYLSILPFSLFINNLFKALWHIPKDIFFYIYHKKYNEAPIGFIDMYTGLFGRGKTLSAVHFVTQYYNRYNNRTVWDSRSHQFVKQYVNILSNVVLAIPYKPFVSMNQIVDIANQQQEYEIENGVHIVNLALIDECSTQLNSRNFKNNFSTSMLNALLTCRHYRLGFCLTSQRFGHCDALLRQVTSKVIECQKLWRLQAQYVYDAWDMENAGSPTQLKPIKRTGFFVLDKDYNAYDTMAVVQNLVKDYESGAMLTDDEVLALQGTIEKSADNVEHLSRKAKKRRKAS